MNFILWPVFDFVAKNKWLQWVLLIATGLVIVRIWMWVHDDSVRRLERKNQEIETAKERARVIETSNQVIRDIEDAKDAAIAAPDSLPEFRGADELREQAPAIAGVILADRRKDEPGS